MKVEQSSANIIRMGNLASLTCIINMLKCQSFIVLIKCKHPTLLYIHKGGYANDMESFAGMNNHLYHININILWECMRNCGALSWCVVMLIHGLITQSLTLSTLHDHHFGLFAIPPLHSHAFLGFIHELFWICQDSILLSLAFEVVTLIDNLFAQHSFHSRH